MSAAPATRPAPRRAAPARTTRRARSPYTDDAAAWVEWCRRAGARLDAEQRAADAVAWCAAGRASGFALPSKLRQLNAAGVDRTHDRIADGDRHPALTVHVVRVGEGQGTPHALAVDAHGVVGRLGAHHARWIAALPPDARRALCVVVLQCTGGAHGPRSRGLNVALTGIGAALRLAALVPAPALVREPTAAYGHARRVRLGHVLATPGALERFPAVVLADCLARHERADWGDLGRDDARANDHALTHGGRLVSTYHGTHGILWIITEHDRSATTLLLPDEY